MTCNDCIKQDTEACPYWWFRHDDEPCDEMEVGKGEIQDW